MVKIEDADFFNIEKKAIGDKRDGDYWVSVKTRGCGCCSDNDFDLQSTKYTKGLLEQWIAKKKDELYELTKQLMQLEQEIKE